LILFQVIYKLQLILSETGNGMLFLNNSQTPIKLAM
jgi:hypothetical protein